jgi:hypothetical protein
MIDLDSVLQIAGSIALGLLALLGLTFVAAAAMVFIVGPEQEDIDD